MISTRKPLSLPVQTSPEWAADNSPAARLSRFLLIGSAKRPTKEDCFIYGSMDCDWEAVCDRTIGFLAAGDRAGISEQLKQVIDELP